MIIKSIQVGKPKVFETNNACSGTKKEWESGICKTVVPGAVQVFKTNILGDGQADLKVHGGVDKAICVYPSEHFIYWKSDLDVDFSEGAFGENLTTEGILENDVCIGDIYRIGSVVVEVSQPRQPCWKLCKYWNIKDLAARVQKTGYTGWYFRVLEEGEFQAGDSMVLESRASERWTIEKANEVMHSRDVCVEEVSELANALGLSDSWRRTLLTRAQKRAVEDTSPRLEGE